MKRKRDEAKERCKREVKVEIIRKRREGGMVYI